MLKQHTVKAAISITGVALHSGGRSTLCIRPAPEDTGIVFLRETQSGIVAIPARSEYVSDTMMSTDLSKNGASICTIEHLMSALHIMGVDNAFIDCTASEVPVLDGSARPYLFLLQSTGLEEQRAPKQFLRIKKTISVSRGDKSAEYKPFDGFNVRFSIAFDHPLICQTNCDMALDVTPESYFDEISRARTFGFMRDYQKLKAMNLAKGGSYDNAVILDDHRVLNPEGLRYDDEFVRHKMLDAIGDMYVIGKPILGAYSGVKSGHALNHQLNQALLSDASAYELISLDAASSTAKQFFTVDALLGSHG